MSETLLKIKKLHPEAVIPKYAKPGDGCFDLVVIDDGVVVEKDGYYYREYDTGLAFEIEPGHVGLIFPRSSARKYSLTLANSIGVVDAGYRGSVKASFKMDGYFRSLFSSVFRSDPSIYKKGERAVQMMILPIPKVYILEVDKLSETERGASGHGSSGK